jgi:hypothetical protein
MHVTSVIVTYGDRFAFLKQVVECCFELGVDNVIIVDNGVSQPSRDNLMELSSWNTRINVVSLGKNTGSAGGFKAGIKKALGYEYTEFIWLLDDDNLPLHKSLSILKSYWHSHETELAKGKVCLLSFREDRKQYLDAVKLKKPDLVLGKKNSFLGLHLADFLSKAFRLFLRKFFRKKSIAKEINEEGEVLVAPYGGMFFHKSLINTIGFPNEDYFVYSDDYEWSYRIPSNGGKILMIPSSEIKDIEMTWRFRKGVKTPFYNYLNNGTDFQVFYSIRNRVNFEKRITTHPILYKLHKLVYFVCLSFFVRRNNIKRFNLIKEAVFDGKTNKLGIKDFEKN